MPLDTTLPLARPIALRDPLDALHALQSLPYPFLLHSALQDDRAHWSFFGADPFAVYRGPDYVDGVREWRMLSARARAETSEACAAARMVGASKSRTPLLASDCTRAASSLGASRRCHSPARFM